MRLNLGAAKLRADVICGNFVDQTSEIAKQAMWQTGVTVPPSQSADSVKITLTTDNPNSTASYRVQIFQSL